MLNSRGFPCLNGESEIRKNDQGEYNNGLEFRCPSCKGNLIANTNTLVCTSCSSQWDIVDGIPKFSKTNRYFGEIPQKQMHECISTAEKYGWRTALKSAGRIHPWVYKYAADPSRADWRFLLPMTKKDIVLDVGCGWGNITFSLAQTAGLVVAIDPVFERVKFLDIRKKQEKMTNICCACADVLDFPFPENYFDTIILNGVLEWIGWSDNQSNPRRAQEKALQKIFDGLKENGNLYIGIENRFGLNYLLGEKDPHSNLPFITLLPRKLADLYSQISKGESYTAYTYSYNEYIKLLSKVGFSTIEFYCPIPDYREFKFIFSLDGSPQFQYLMKRLVNERYVKSKNWAKFMYLSKLCRLHKVPMRIVKHFVPSFSIVCKKRNIK